MAKTKNKTYQDVMTEIGRLHVEADRLRAAEVAEVIAKMKVAIAAYELTPADLFGSGRVAAKVAKPGKVSKTKARNGATVKFRDDKGNTWIGRGKRPDWFKTALKAGKTPDELRVQ